MACCAGSWAREERKVGSAGMAAGQVAPAAGSRSPKHYRWPCSERLELCHAKHKHGEHAGMSPRRELAAAKQDKLSFIFLISSNFLITCFNCS